MATGSVVTNSYNPNLYSRKVLFENPDYFDYAITSGTGVVDRYRNIIPDSFTSSTPYAVRVTNTANQTTDLVWGSASGLDSFMTSVPAVHFFSFSLKLSGSTINNVLEITVFQGGSPLSEKMEFNLNSTTMPFVGRFYTFGIPYFFDSAYDYTFSWKLKSDAGGTISKTIHITDLCIQRQDTNYFYPSPYTPPRDIVIFDTQAVTIPTTPSHDFVRVDVNIDDVLVGDTVVFNKVGDDILASTFTLQQPQVKTNGVVTFKASNIHNGTASSVTDDITFKITR